MEDGTMAHKTPPELSGGPLYGPIPGSTPWGDAALFEDESGTAVARMKIAPVFSVPILVVADPEENRPVANYKAVVARCPLIGAPDEEGYRGWDDPSFQELCRRFGIDPDKQRPTYDEWCRDIGTTLLETAMTAFEEKRFAEHAAAGKAAEALARNATPASNPIGDVLARLNAIQDEGLRERARAALEQLERSADWQAGRQRTEASMMREMIDGACANGTPVTVAENADEPGSVIVFGEIDELTQPPTLMERVRRWFR